METLSISRKLLATKISYISHIMIYFGYIHECAELYRQLWKDSREEWNSNSNAIFKIIMKNKDSRLKMLFKHSFTKKNAKFLLNNGIYNYFSIGILIDDINSWTSVIYFIENLDDFAPFLWIQIKLNFYINIYFYFMKYCFILIIITMKQIDSQSCSFIIKFNL